MGIDSYVDEREEVVGHVGQPVEHSVAIREEWWWERRRRCTKQVVDQPTNAWEVDSGRLDLAVGWSAMVDQSQKECIVVG